MGFNTVAFLLNDFSHEIEKSPHAIAWGLANPPMHGHASLVYWRRCVNQVADDNAEPHPHNQVVSVLPSFHADSTKYFRAGGNCIQEMHVLEYGEKDGKRTVTLELPDWAND